MIASDAVELARSPQHRPARAAVRQRLVGAALLSAVATVHAATIDEHRPLNSGGRVSVNNVAGSVQVSSWDRNEVSLRGETSGEVEAVTLSGDADDLSIVVKLPRRSHGGNADLQLSVPALARVVVESVSADVIAQELRGPLNVNTVSGSAQLLLSSPEVSVQTVSGDITLRGPSRSTFVKTVSGDMHLAGMQGRLGVETVSGNVQLDGGRFSDVHLKSVSGDMRLDVTLTPQAQINGDTLSGDITLDVPADVSGTALLKSFSGDASCDANPSAVSTSSATPGRNGRHEYTWGNGAGARIELSSFSGDIHVLRKEAHGAQNPPPFVGKD